MGAKLLSPRIQSIQSLRDLLDLRWAVQAGSENERCGRQEKSPEMSEHVPPDRQQVTTLLRAWSGGNKQALDELMPLLYDQLHRLASSCLRAERPDHTLRATALVHEAYLQLVDSEVAWESRIHFYAVAARVLRHILVDYAKASRRQKRGGGAEKLSLDEAIVVGPEISSE